VILSINGASREVSTVETVAELVADLHLVPETVLIEHNGVALRRNEWATRPLHDNDQIEVLQIVAGG
jgi:sulfur carrier protein